MALVTAVITLVSTTAVVFATDTGAVRDLVIACIGLLGLTISLLLEVLFRVTERARTREQYGRLLEGIEEFPDLLPPVASAVEASIATLRKARIPQLKDEVFAILTHARAQLEELAQGKLRRDRGDNTLVLERFEHTECVIRGTTDDRDIDWWHSDAGKQFLDLSKRLIQDRAVIVERIWILTEPPSESVLGLLDEHKAAGVHVYVVPATRRDLDRRLLVNLTIMDDCFMQQDIVNREGETVEYLYSENGTDLEFGIRGFAQLKSYATKYTGPDSILGLFAAVARRAASPPAADG